MVQQESRVKKTLLNARVNLIFYFLTLCLSFFSRKIFLDCLGASFLGLTGTMQNLLSYLNLAELGIGVAIGYLLYKPLFDHDETKISEIISVMGYLYRVIGLIVLGLGILLSCFLPLIFPSKETGFPIGLIFLIYYSFLGSSLIGYFINYRQNLLGADQRNYVVTAYFQTATIIKTLIQMALAYYTKSYYLWVIVEFVFGIAHSIILNWKINQTYPWLNSNIKQGRLLLKKYPEVMQKTKQLFIQKLSATVQYWTLPILIYSFTSLHIVAFYGNYTMITDKIGRFVNAFFESSSAGVGNLIAEGNKTKILQVFWELNNIRYFIGFTIGFALFMTVDSFISIWLGSEYILGNGVLLLIIINVIIGYTRGGIMQFVNGYGLFYDVWAAIAEIILNLGLAILLGSKFGLAGVLSGGIVSQIIIVYIWKPIFLYRKGFKLPITPYWLTQFKILLILFIPAAIVYYIISRLNTADIGNFFDWAIYAAIVIGSYFILAFGLLFFSSREFRDFLYRFRNVIHK